MGKILVIKGADFSANAVNMDNENLYEGMSTALQVGYTLSSSGSGGSVAKASNTARTCIYNLSLSDYYAAGYRSIKIYSANPSSLDLILGVGTTSSCYWYNAAGSSVNFAWNTGATSLQGDLGNNTSLFINIKHSNGSDFSASTKIEELISKVELY